MSDRSTDETALADALEDRDAAAPMGPPASIDELVANEDVDGLIELGAAYRVGGDSIERDLFKAVECFEAASRFGSEVAEYLVGLAFLNGLGVTQDIAEGAKRMRSAAQRGSLRAKVYVANLYEMGVHYAPDREKASVWYRNVARAGGIDSEPESDAYELAMAELGCVRYCLQLVSDEALPTKDRAFYLKKAKAMGYGHRLAQAKRTSTVSQEAAPEDSEDDAEAESEPSAEPEGDSGETPEDAPEEKSDGEDEEKSGDEPEKKSVPLGSQWTFGRGLLAFVIAAFFGAASFVAAWLATEGSIALAEHGRALPQIGEMHDIVFGLVILLLGVLPAAVAYKGRVVAIAGLFGIASAGLGWYLHASHALLWSEASQAGAFGLGAALSILLVLGVLGGTRRMLP